MKFLNALFAFFLFSLAAKAQITKPVFPENSDKNSNPAVTERGLKDGRMNVIIQNAYTGDPAADRKYKIDELHAEAEQKSAKNPIFKQRQFELAAEMLPYIAPWINEIAKPCMETIKPGEKEALAKSADCTSKAVIVFKSNPAAFISRLPASDRAKLESLAQDKLKSSPSANGK